MLGRALGGFVAFSAVLLLCAPGVRAQGAMENTADPTSKPWGPRLSYTTVPGCLPESTFHDSVAVIYGGEDPFDPNAPGLLRVTFAKIPGGYRGTVQYTPPKGDPWPVEVMTHASCSALFHSLVLLATVDIGDPPKAPPPPAPPPPPPEPTPKPPDPVVSEPPPPHPDPTPKPQPPPPPPKPPMDIAIAFSASALMTAGFTADVGPAFQIGAEARFEDWFALHLEVRGVLPGQVYARDVYDKSISFSSPRAFDASQLSALLAPCLRFAKYFAGCAVGQAGFILTQTPVETAFLPSLGVGPRFAVELPLGETFGVFAFGEALFYPNARGSGFTRGGPNGEPAPNVVWRPSEVSGFFGVGLSVQFK